MFKLNSSVAGSASALDRNSLWFVPNILFPYFDYLKNNLILNLAMIRTSRHFFSDGWHLTAVSDVM